LLAFSSQFDIIPKSQICCVTAKPLPFTKYTLFLKPRFVGHEHEPNTRWLDITAVKFPNTDELIVGGVWIGDLTGTHFGEQPKQISRSEETPEGQLIFQINRWNISLGLVEDGDQRIFPRRAFGEGATLVHVFAMLMVFEYLRRIQAAINADCTGLICHNIKDCHDLMDCPEGSNLHKQVAGWFREKWGIVENDDADVIKKEHARIPSETILKFVRVKMTLDEI